MRLRRIVTYFLYKIDTLSGCKLALILFIFFLGSTSLLLLTLKPKKILRAFQTKAKSVREVSRDKMTDFSHLKNYYLKSEVHPELANFPVAFDADVLVYNRVPKCASITITRLLHKIGGGEMNKNFHVTSPYSPGEHPWMSEDDLRSHASWMMHLNEEEKPLVYIRHEYFVDFTRWGATKQPLYVNMIRDPIERFTSFFYFIRFGNKEGDGADVYLTDVQKRMTIDECVKLQVQECLKPKWQLIPYFCGQDAVCRQRSTAALEQAKTNIDKYYAVVGIVEDLTTSIEVMELMLPRYFKGAKGLMSDPSALARNDTLTVGKKAPSAETIEFLKYSTSLRLEYELYAFVKERLYRYHRLVTSS